MEVPGKFKGSDEDPIVEKSDKLCEHCQSDGIKQQADGFCKECEEYMCNTCFRQHLKVKSCRNHVMVDVHQPSTSSMPGRVESAVKCKQHGGETIKYFCRKHEVVGCGDCVVQSHNVCKAEFIHKLAKDFKQCNEFKALIRKIEHLASVNNTNCENILENERNNTELLEKALEDIRQFRTDINQYLDKVEEDVMSEVKAVMSDNERLLAKLENECELLSIKIENIKQAFNSESFQDNELFINTVVNKPTLSEIETAIAEIQSKCLKKFNFVPDDQLNEIVSSKKCLGRLITTTISLSSQDTQKTEEKTKDVTDKKDAGMKSVGTVTVGARVRDVYFLPEYREDIEEYLPGTVTAVHADGMVTVKWDDRGKGRHNIRFLEIIG